MFEEQTTHLAAAPLPTVTDFTLSGQSQFPTEGCHTWAAKRQLQVVEFILARVPDEESLQLTQMKSESDW